MADPKTCDDAKAQLAAAKKKQADDKAALQKAAQDEQNAVTAKADATTAKTKADQNVKDRQADVKRDNQHIVADAALIAEGGLGNSAANQQLNADYQHFKDLLSGDSSALNNAVTDAQTAAQTLKDAATTLTQATANRNALSQSVADDGPAVEKAQGFVDKLCGPTSTGALVAQGYVGQPFSFNINSVPGLAGYASYSAGVNWNGSPQGAPLPPGLTCNSVGLISGTPTKEGSTTVTLAAWNSLSRDMPGGVTRLFASLTINIGPEISATSVTNAPFIGSPQDTVDLTSGAGTQNPPGISGTFTPPPGQPNPPVPIVSLVNGQPNATIVSGNATNNGLTNFGTVNQITPDFSTVPVPSFNSVQLGSANSNSFGLPSNLVNSAFSPGTVQNGFAGISTPFSQFTNLNTGIIVLGSVSGDTFGSSNVVNTDTNV